MTAGTMFDLQKGSSSKNIRGWNLQEIFFEDTVAHTRYKTRNLRDDNDLSDSLRALGHAKYALSS